ncbi:hypothetical protein I6E68_01845 [Salinibacterium sp. NSLL150]|uniref:hypothetical protein n=1 Tax=unclassified Salinibacterium TaxID=2632331 RepID=UPI0018CF05B3|nr:MULTISPECIES: hypothetical protein [unclassified Salinibacterium]MBH0097877.1 hypothetical protein [Salinibacterium sp. NSLL35]MBH0100632.1 hypothetical protein [Salinibacterium sp. NSLL150]MBH0103391.1 hypothetical protein [Salinibacterium sp. NSLL16]MBH0106152.1 hypothetical protein [Salinibacterium sp. NSLL17]
MDVLQGPKTGVASSPVRAIVASAGAFLVALSLAGCTPESPADGDATPPAPAVTSEPETDPVVAPLVIPECDALLSISTARFLYTDNTELIEEETPGQARNFQEVPITTIDTILANATESRQCLWGIPSSDSFFTLAIADISEDDAIALETETLAASYSGLRGGNFSMFSLHVDGPVGPVGSNHFVIDDLWLYSTAYDLPATITVVDSALLQIRNANPSRDY